MDDSSSVRIQIARELHDGIAQEVAALGYQIDEVIGSHQTPQKTRDQLRDLRVRIITLSGLIRDEIFQLRGLDPRPILEVIEAMAESIFNDREIELRVEWERDFPLDYRTQLLKLIQEALLNIKVHTSATKVEIIQKQKSLSIRDNGGGKFDLLKDRWGIIGMKERAELMSAEVEFNSDEEGSEVILTWNISNG